MRILIFLSLILPVQASAGFTPCDPALGGYHIDPAKDNVCPDELMSIASATAPADFARVQELVGLTREKTPECYEKNQGHSMLSRLSGSSHANHLMKALLTQLQPKAKPDFRDKIRIYDYSVRPARCLVTTGQTALMKAARNAQAFDYSDLMIWHLLVAGANPNLQDELTGVTALMEAAGQGSDLAPGALQYRKLLLLRLLGANPNHQSWSQALPPYRGTGYDTVFHIQARDYNGSGKLEGLKLLLDPVSVIAPNGRVDLAYLWKVFQPNLRLREDLARGLTEANVLAWLARVPRLDARALCLRNARGMTVLDEIRANNTSWAQIHPETKQAYIQLLERFYRAIARTFNSDWRP